MKENKNRHTDENSCMSALKTSVFQKMLLSQKMLALTNKLYW